MCCCFLRICLTSFHFVLTELFKCFDRMQAHTKQRYVKLFIIFREQLWNKNLFSDSRSFSKSWFLIGLGRSRFPSAVIWNFVYSARLIFDSIIYYQLAKCLEFIGPDLDEEKLQKRKWLSKCDLANNVILTSFVAFSTSRKCAICFRGLC